MSSVTRRHTLGLLAGTALATILGLPVAALTESQATRLIDAAVNDINKVINSGKSESAMYAEFESIFRKYADVPTIARSALGPPARQASSAQMKAFTDAFSGYLSRKYGARFREFIGGSISVTGASPVNKFYRVSAVANLRGQSPFDVSFMVSDQSGSDKFFDLLIEGISLLKSERTEIGAMLDKRRGNVDSLIQDLKKAG